MTGSGDNSSSSSGSDGGGGIPGDGSTSPTGATGGSGGSTGLTSVTNDAITIDSSSGVDGTQFSVVTNSNDFVSNGAVAGIIIGTIMFIAMVISLYTGYKHYDRVAETSPDLEGAAISPPAL